MKFSSGYFLLAVYLFLTIGSLYTYFDESKILKKEDKKSFTNLELLQISDLTEQYELISMDSDTFLISKEFSPDLHWSTFENFNFEDKVGIETFMGIVSKITTSKHETLIDVDIKKKLIKENEWLLIGFYICGSCSTLIIALMMFIPKLIEWSRKGVEKGILKIPDTVKLKDYYFEYNINDVKVLIFHELYMGVSKYGNKSIIKVFIPSDAQGKLHRHKMKSEYFDGKKCFTFNHFIPFSTRHKALEKSIKEKFK